MPERVEPGIGALAKLDELSCGSFGMGLKLWDAGKGQADKS